MPELPRCSIAAATITALGIVGGVASHGVLLPLIIPLAHTAAANSLVIAYLLLGIRKQRRRLAIVSKLPI
jgi:hypothetical protein